MGAIPWVRAARRFRARQPSVSVVAFHEPKSEAAEAYRRLRTNLFAVVGEEPKVIAVTASETGTGTSTLAANLAVSIAQVGKNVLLIDVNLRRPTLHTLFGLTAGAGLASVLSDGTAVAAAIQPSGINGLSVLPCGPLPANPAELLSSSHFKALLTSVRANYDFVVIDTCPVLEVTDPAVVATRVDGMLVAMRLTKSGLAHAERAKETLAGVQARVLGIVVNAVNRRFDAPASFPSSSHVRLARRSGTAQR
jgi:capsular exopolysaccharide synthesis family protein